MTMSSLLSRMVSSAVAVSLLALPTMAAAAAPSAGAPQGVSPVVALSFLASDTSRAALCGVAGANAAAAASTSAAASGATAQAGPVQGCVLPAVDAAPVAVPAVASQGFSMIGPLAALLAGLVAILVLANISSQRDARPPISPA